MSDGLRKTVTVIANTIGAIALPAIIGTQAKLEGNYQGGSLSGLVSQNYEFDLNSYQGCGAGKILMNGFCESEPALKDQVECGIPNVASNRKITWGRKKRAVNKTTVTEENFPWSVQFEKPNNKGACSGAIISKNFVLSSADCQADYINSPLDFETILGETKAVKKVHVPTDEELCDGDRKITWGRKRRSPMCDGDRKITWGRRRRGASSHDISLHETAVAIWSNSDLVPVCVNRPSLSLFTPHQVIMTGFSPSEGLTTVNGAILPSSDAAAELAVANLDACEDGNRKITWGRKRRDADDDYCPDFATGNRKITWGRKRRAVNEKYCFDGADGNRKITWGRKRRAANTTECFASQGDSMSFQYPTGQVVIGGIVQGAGDFEMDNGNRKITWGRKRRSTNAKALQVTPVHYYARWIYQVAGVWSKVEEQPAEEFSPAAFAPETWIGTYPEYGFAELSRSVASLVEALPALQLINDNSVGQVVDLLSSAPTAMTASGLGDLPLCGACENDDGNRKFTWGRKRRSANDEFCQSLANDNRKITWGRKRRDADQCLDLNFDNFPICGLNNGDRKITWGRKRRAANDGTCVGDANLGRLLAAFSDNNQVGDRKITWGKK